MRSAGAWASAFMVPKWRASSLAPCTPTWRIPRANSRVESGRSLEAWIASTSCPADFSANPSSASSCSGVISYRSATSLMSLASSNAFTRSGPSPRMSIAPRDVDPDLLQRGDPNLGRELARDGPTRLAVTDGAELGVQLERVHLHHDTVGAVVELVEQRLELRDLPVRGREVGRERVVGLDGEPPFGKLLQQVVLSRDRELLTRGFDVKAKNLEAATARDLGIELAQRAGRGVAGIGEGRLARALALFVELGEAGLGEVDFTANFHQLGPALAVQPQRHVEHGAQVGGDVLALDAVAAGRPRDEHPVLVRETHRRAVDLHL